MAHTNLALLGILGLVQTAFLPGYLLLRWMRVAAGAVAAIVLSFGLSLLANYLLVAGLVVAGLYRPAIVYAVFAVELLLWLCLDYHRLRMPLQEAILDVRVRARSFYRELDGACPFASRWLRLSMIGAAIAVIAGFALAGLSEAGSIFQQWDAVVSWNRWAVELAANRLPQMASFYPQLLPANISLSYVFMQTSEVWIFAKGMQFLFCLMLMLAMLDAARQARSFGLVPGVAITYLLLVALLRYRMLASGYADAPLAFFAWMAIYVLLLAERAADDRQRCKWLLLGALFAAAAAVTKQMGLYVAATYPLLACLLAERQTLRGNDSAPCPFPRSAAPLFPFSFRSLLASFLLISAIAAPWYVYKYAEMRSGREFDNTPLLVADTHQGRDLPSRLAHAGAEFLGATTMSGGAMLLLALAASLGDRRARRLLGLFVAPLGLLWAAAFSYDTRNLAMLIPVIGMAAGIGLARIVCWTESMTRRRRDTAARRHDDSAVSFLPRSASLHLRVSITPKIWLRVWHVAACLAMATAAFALGVPNQTLLSLQQRQQRSVGISALNEQLYAHADAHADCSLIATDYVALRWLPDLAPRGVPCACNDLTAFRRTFDRAEVRYVLVRSQDAAAEVCKFLARPSAARLLFQSHGYAFYEKLKPLG